MGLAGSWPCLQVMRRVTVTVWFIHNDNKMGIVKTPPRMLLIGLDGHMHFADASFIFRIVAMIRVPGLVRGRFLYRVGAWQDFSLLKKREAHSCIKKF